VLRTSPLYLSGKALKVEWVDFIRRTNAIERHGIEPHVDQIARNLSVLFRGVATCQMIVMRTRYRTDGAGDCLSRLKSGISQIRDISSEVFSRPRAERFEGFDIEEYDRPILEVIRFTNTIFERFIPRFSPETGEMSQVRAEMVRAASSVGALMRALEMFDVHMLTVKKGMLQLNAELNEVHRAMRLPFRIALSMHGEKVNCAEMRLESGDEDRPKEADGE
jgi:hypothetical protein